MATVMQRTALSQQCASVRPARAVGFQPARRNVQVRSLTEGGDIRASKMEKALFGENFGARDPFAGEIESNFGEKVLGNYNTEHIIKPPDAIKGVIGLSSRSCKDNADSLALLNSSDMERLRNQVPGWKVVADGKGPSAIRHEWQLKDEEAVQKLAGMIRGITEAEGHDVDLVFISKTLVADLTTKSLGGLTENDFIVAAKINDLDISSLKAPKKVRYWA